MISPLRYIPEILKKMYGQVITPYLAHLTHYLSMRKVWGSLLLLKPSEILKSLSASHLYILASR